MSMSTDVIRLAHGNGGRFMRTLVDQVIADALRSPSLDTSVDAATVATPSRSLIVTTDGFTVQPLEFPGGDIGTLAVNGTINDLAVASARALHLTLSVIVEEGLPIATLRRLLERAGTAAAAAGVGVVAGDTKVVPRGYGGGLYLVTTGLGRSMRADGVRPLGMHSIEAGDEIIVSGPIGDHGTTVLLAREELGLSASLCSDCANVTPLVEPIANLPGLRFLRDPTRGGLATVGHEVARATGLDVVLEESCVPVRAEVASVCHMLGFDPLVLACEGRVVAIAHPADSGHLLERWRALPMGRQAARIGMLCAPRSTAPLVRLTTPLGGERVIDELEDDPLPRIC